MAPLVERVLRLLRSPPTHLFEVHPFDNYDPDQTKDRYPNNQFLHGTSPSRFRIAQGRIVCPGRTVSTAASPSLSSSTTICRSAVRSVSSCTLPEGQRIVSRSTRVASATPKWTTLGICDRKLLSGYNSRTTRCPPATAVSRLPMPSRLLPQPRRETSR